MWNITNHFQYEQFDPVFFFFNLGKTQKWSPALSLLLIAQSEMGDTSELCKSDDSLPRQTHTLAHSGIADRSTD